MPRAMRIKVAYGWYNKGDVIFPNGTTRDLLLQQGYIEEMPEVGVREVEEHTFDALSEEPFEEDLAPAKRPRGRPRKEPLPVTV